MAGLLDPGRHLVRRALGAAMLVVGLLTALWPRSQIEAVGWLLHDTDPVTAGPFRLTIDIGDGRVDAPGGELLRGGRFDPGAELMIGAAAGDGVVTIEVTNPAGAPVLAASLAPVIEPVDAADVAGPGYAVPANSVPFAEVAIVSREEGTHRVVVASQTGAPGFNMRVTTDEERFALPIFRYATTWAVAGLWALGGILIVAFPRGRLAGVPALGAGLAVPAAFFVGGTHAWFWSIPYLVIGAAAIGAVAVGAALLAPRGGPRRRVAGIVVGVGGALLSLFALSAGGAAGNYITDPGDWEGWGDYGGDYMVLGFYLLLLTAAIVTAAFAGALVGAGAPRRGEDREDEPESSPRPPAARPARRPVTWT